MVKPFSVALTGGIGSGKSTVAEVFQEQGVPTIDADIISHTIVTPGKPCFAAIISEFGSILLSEDGSLDRLQLRDIVFNDAKAKDKLEKILHPGIYEEIDNLLHTVNSPYCLIVIPLLIESQATDKFDRILLIDVPEELQIIRTTERDNISAEIAAKIIKSQASRQERLMFADDIIVNDIDIKNLNESVLHLHKKYLKLATEK